MAISFVNQGTTPAATGAGTGTTSVTPAAPASLANGNLVVIYVFDKPDTAIPTTPQGWTYLGSVAGGTGTTGLDAGPVRVTAYARVKRAGWSAMPAFTVTGASCCMAQAFQYANATGFWGISTASGADITSGTGWSITFDVNPGITAGDWVLVGTCVPSDTPTWSLQSLAATGVTVWGVNAERSEPKTTQGNDLGGCVTQQTVTTGTSTAAPTYTATASAATTGVSLLVRLREITAPDIVGTTFDSASAGTFNLMSWDNLPPTVNKDLALIWWTHSDTTTESTPPPGFTKFGERQDGNVIHSLYSRTCDGTESGAITYALNGASRTTTVMMLLRGWEIDKAASAGDAGSDASHTPASVTPDFGGSAILISNGERATTGSDRMTAPTGYSVAEVSASVGTAGSFTGVAYEGSDGNLTGTNAAGVAVNPGPMVNNVATTDVAMWTIALRLPVTQGAVALTATSTLTAAGDVTGVPTHEGAAALTATLTLTVGAVREAEVAVGLTATSTLTTGGTREQSAEVALTATSTLTTAGVREPQGETSLIATSTLTVGGTRVPVGAAALTATSTLTVQPDLYVTMPYQEDFSSPFAWAAFDRGARYSDFAVVSGSGVITTGAASAVGMLRSINVETDQGVVITFTNGAASGVLNLALRGDTTYHPTFTTRPSNSWLMQYNPTLRPRLVKTVVNVSTTFTASTGPVIAAGTQYKTRFELVGQVVRCRTWLATDPEPSTWNHDRSDNTEILSGRLHVGGTSNGTVTVDDISWYVPVSDVQGAVALTGTSILTVAGIRDAVVAAPLTATSTLTAAGTPTRPAAVALTATSTLSVAGTVIVTFPHEEFFGQTNGSPWYGWVTQAGAASPDSQIYVQDGHGIMIPTNVWTRATLNAAAVTDQAILMKVYGGAGNVPRMGIRTSGGVLTATEPNNGVVVALEIGAWPEVAVYDNGSKSSAYLDGFLDLVADEYYMVRIESVGTVYRAKVWPADEVEPAAWGHVGTTSVLPAGVPFVGTFPAGTQFGIDELSWYEPLPVSGAVALTATSTLTVAGTIEGGGVTHEGAVALTSTSTLTVAGVREQPAAVGLTATSTLTVTGVRDAVVAAGLTAASTLTVAGERAAVVQAPLTGTSTLTIAGVRTAVVAVALTGTSTLTVAGTRGQPGVANLTAVATLTAVGTRQQFGAVALVATSTLTAVGTRVQPGAAALTAVSTLTAAGTRVQLGVVALSAISTLTTTGVRDQQAVVSLAGAATLTVAGVRTAVVTAPLTATSTLTVAGVRTAEVAVALVGISTLTAAGVRTAVVAAALTTTSTLTISGTIVLVATVNLTATSTLTSTAVREQLSQVDLVAASVLTVGATIVKVGDVALIATSTLTVEGTYVHIGLVALSAASTLSVEGLRIVPGALELEASSTLSVEGLLTQAATVALQAVSDLTIAGIREQLAVISLAATSDLVIAGVITQLADVSLSVTSVLTVGATVEQFAAAALTAQSTLFASAFPVQQLAASLIATSTLTVSGVRAAVVSAELVSTAVLTVSAVRVQVALVTLTAQSTLSATGVRQQDATVSLVAISTLTIAGVRVKLGDVALAAAATLTVAGMRAARGQAALIAVSTLTVGADRTAAAQVALLSVSTLVVGTQGGAQGQVALVAVATLSVQGVKTLLFEITLSADSTLTIGGVRTVHPTVSLTASSTLDLVATAHRIVAAFMLATSDLTVATERETAGLLELEATSDLSVEAANIDLHEGWGVPI